MRLILIFAVLLYTKYLPGQSLLGKWYNADGGTIVFAENGAVKIHHRNITNKGVYEYLYHDSIAHLRIQMSGSPVFDYPIYILNEHRLEFATPNGFMFIYFKNKNDARAQEEKEEGEERQETKERLCPRCTGRGRVVVGERYNQATLRMDQIIQPCPLCMGRGRIIQ